MNEKASKEEIPVGFRAAHQALQKKHGGGSLTHKSMSYRLLGVNSLFVQERYHSARVRNPAHRGIRALWEPEYIQGSMRGLSDLYVDGDKAGPLHGGSEGPATAIQQMLIHSQEPVDLLISGHFTESGWYIDSIKVLKEEQEEKED